MNYLNWQSWFYVLADIVMAYWILRWIVIELQSLASRIEANQKSPDAFSAKPFYAALALIVILLLLAILIYSIVK